MTSHRTRTRSATRSWQLGALALAAGAAALGFTPIAKYLSAKPFVPPAGPSTATGPLTNARGLDADQAALLAARMNAKAGRETVVPPPATPVPVVVETTHVGEADVPPPESPSEWAYKGYLGGPNFKAAQIVVDEKQMLVREGRTYEDIKVVEVRPTHMTIEEGGVQKRLDIAARVTNGYPTGGAGRPMAAMGRPGQPNNNGKGMASTFQNGINSGLDAQRRLNMAPVNPPVAANILESGGVMEEMKTRFENMSEEERELYGKMLGDTNTDLSERMGLLEKIGLSPKATPEERVNFMQMFNVNPNSDPRLYEAVKGGSPRK